MTDRYKPRKCAGCPKTFTPRSGTQKYCDECGPVVKRMHTDNWKTDHPDANAKHQEAHRRRKDKDGK